MELLHQAKTWETIALVIISRALKARARDTYLYEKSSDINDLPVLAANEIIETAHKASANIPTRFSMGIPDDLVVREEQKLYAEELIGSLEDVFLSLASRKGTVNGSQGRRSKRFKKGSSGFAGGETDIHQSAVLNVAKRQLSKDPIFNQDTQGNTVLAGAILVGSHPGREKGYRPDPRGGLAEGDHRGHLVPENGVEKSRLVNRAEFIISESPVSNRLMKNDVAATAVVGHSNNSNFFHQFI